MLMVINLTADELRKLIENHVRLQIREHVPAAKLDVGPITFYQSGEPELSVEDFDKGMEVRVYIGET